MAELEARNAEIGKTLECPSEYTLMDAREDGQRLNELDSVRRRGAVLTTAEDVEDARLHARLEAYRRSPEGVGRQRISELGFVKFSRRLTPAEENELADLQARYPDLPLVNGRRVRALGADAGLHADQARRHIGKPRHLARSRRVDRARQCGMSSCRYRCRLRRPRR